MRQEVLVEPYGQELPLLATSKAFEGEDRHHVGVQLSGRRHRGRDLCRAGGALPQPPRQRLDLLAGAGIQLLRQDLCVFVRHAERRPPLPRRLQRLHQAKGHIGAVRLMPSDFSPPTGRRLRISVLPRLLSQRAQGLPILAGQSVPLPVHPLVELGGVGNPESIQEGAPVEFHRLLRLPIRQRPAELDHINLHPVRVQPEPASPGDQSLVRQLAPQAMHVGVQAVPGRLLRHSRPEETHQLPTAEGVAWSAGQQRQEGEGIAVRRRTAQHLPVGEERRTAQKPQVGHGIPCDRDVTPVKERV